MVASLLLLVGLLLPCFSGERVEIKLKSGKTVTGELRQESKSEIVLETELGTLSIQRSKILSRRTISDSGRRAGEQKAEPKTTQKPAGIDEGEGESDDPFSLSKIVAEVEAKGGGRESREKGSSKARAKAKAGGSGSKAGNDPSFPRSRDLVSEVVLAHSSDSLYSGRLLDRFAWANKMELGTKLSIFAALYLLFWASISVLTRLLDIDNSGSGKSAAAALIWVGIITGVLLVPNPTHIILGILGFCLFVAWLMTTRGILGANWTQSIYLFVLGCFGVLLLYLLVEVGSNILELKV